MFDFRDIYVIGFSLFLVYVLKTYTQLRAVWKQFGAIPGRRTLFTEFTDLARISKDVKYISPGLYKGWTEKHAEHRKYGWDVISSIALWPTPRGGILVADAHVIKTILNSRQRFPKPLESFEVLNLFGKNLVTTEFDEWKRHRKIAAPAFNEMNKKLAFEESVRAITQLFEGRWCGKQEIAVDNFLDLTMAMALMAISAAGFGLRIGWEDDEVPPGHKFSFKRSIQSIDTGIFIKLLCPKWLVEWGPIELIREARDGFSEFQSYLVELINERKNSNEKGDKRDLLSNLVGSNDDLLDDGEQKLGEDELMGNVFIFYLAGYETSGHTLSFVMSMLAVHQEEQEALYRHIQEILPDGRLPTYEDVPRLKRVTATLYETLRMFPPIPIILKHSAEDTTLLVGNQAGEKTVFHIPAGTTINIDTPGLHYNPRYWEDPFTFKPERFLGEWDRDAFVPFSRGPRACIGRGFIEATAVAILTTLVQRYKVEPHPKFAGESFEQLKEKYSQGSTVISLAPSCSSLLFKRRK